MATLTSAEMSGSTAAVTEPSATKRMANATSSPMSSVAASEECVAVITPPENATWSPARRAGAATARSAASVAGRNRSTLTRKCRSAYAIRRLREIRSVDANAAPAGQRLRYPARQTDGVGHDRPIARRGDQLPGGRGEDQASGGAAGSRERLVKQRQGTLGLRARDGEAVVGRLSQHDGGAGDHDEQHQPRRQHPPGMREGPTAEGAQPPGHECSAFTDPNLRRLGPVATAITYRPIGTAAPLSPVSPDK